MKSLPVNRALNDIYGTLEAQRNHHSIIENRIGSNIANRALSTLQIALHVQSYTVLSLVACADVQFRREERPTESR